jgi:hypothetical protein
MSSLDSYFRDHWVTIEPDRFARYDEMFRLDDKRADKLLAAGPATWWRRSRAWSARTGTCTRST